MATARFFLCQANEIGEGSARGFDPRGEGCDTIFVVCKGGRLRGWRNACPHYGDTPMAWRKDAYLDSGATHIVCSAHGAQFAIDTGVCTLGPCLGEALIPVTLIIGSENNIYAELEQI